MLGFVNLFTFVNSRPEEKNLRYCKVYIFNIYNNYIRKSTIIYTYP